MSYFKEVKIDTNNATGDAFGRVRISSPDTIFDSKQLYNSEPLFWDDQETSGTGTGSTHSTDTASTTMTVGATTAGRRVRQTFMRFNYQPGKSQQIMMTFVLDKSGGGTDISRRVGYFDEENGIFLEDDAGTYKIVRRTSVTGTPVDNAVNQSAWNVDLLDGTGPSGITIDFTKSQILVIDYEWLGVGRVRVGFNIDGVTYIAHEFRNANNLDTVYMSTPNLPLRFEITNGGTGAASSLEHICCSVLSEGGQEQTGIVLADSLGTSTVNANTSGTYYALIGIRLKATDVGATVKLISQNLIATNATNYHWQLRFNPTVAGTFTYSDVTNSSVQIAKGDTASNPSTNTVTGGQVIASGFGSGGATQRVTDLVNLTSRQLGTALDGTRDTIVLCISGMTSNGDFGGGITWRETR